MACKSTTVIHADLPVLTNCSHSVDDENDENDEDDGLGARGRATYPVSSSRKYVPEV